MVNFFQEKDEVIKTTILLPPEDHEFIRQYAFKNKKTMGKVIRELVKELRAKEEKK